MDVKYTIDGVSFRDFGVFVSSSDGLLTRPKQKRHATVSWDDSHGIEVDLTHRFLEPREIVLSCFVKANNEGDLLAKVNRFSAVFDAKRLLRLMVEVGVARPLVYDVYLKDEIDIKKKWDNGLQVGVFALKLVEPHPVKRVLKHIRTSTSNQICTITINTPKAVSVHWGDGSVADDVIGSKTIGHTYTTNGTYYPVVSGDIDEIISFSSNATTEWDKI